MPRIPAFLIVGPTGSGKTPLGETIEKYGLCGQRFHHFDFGVQLRKAAEGSFPQLIHLKNLIQCILKEGRLLSSEEYHLFDELLAFFLSYKSFKDGDYLFLNGFPRDVSQAQHLEREVEIRKVIYLSVTPEILLSRLTKDPAGDRRGRKDDTPRLIKRKLEWFSQKSRPLVDYYQRLGISVIEIKVEEEDTGLTLYHKFLSKGIMGGGLES